MIIHKYLPRLLLTDSLNFKVAIGEIRAADQHIHGIFAMAELNGGPQSIGLTGLLEQMYSRFVIERKLKGRDLSNICGSIPVSVPVSHPVLQAV